MSARHTGGAYFKSHHKSRLAFIETSAMIWCDDQTPYLDDPANVEAVEARIRKNVTARLGAATAGHVEHFVAVEMAAFRNELIAREMCDKINQITKSRPKKGNLRRDIPEHLPLRPSRAIIASHAIRVRATTPSASTNAIYDQVAEHFNDGIPKSEAGGRLTNRSVRSACESYGLFDHPHRMMDSYRSAVQRFQSTGSPHVWDWNFYDAMVWGQAFERDYGYDASELSAQMTYLLRDLPLASFERLYSAARSNPRYARLLGVDLAHAIDAHVGLRKWATSDMEVLAPLIQSAKGRTANATR